MGRKESNQTSKVTSNINCIVAHRPDKHYLSHGMCLYQVIMTLHFFEYRRRWRWIDESTRKSSSKIESVGQIINRIPGSRCQQAFSKPWHVNLTPSILYKHDKLWLQAIHCFSWKNQNFSLFLLWNLKWQFIILNRFLALYWYVHQRRTLYLCVGTLYGWGLESRVPGTHKIHWVTKAHEDSVLTELWVVYVKNKQPLKINNILTQECWMELPILIKWKSPLSILWVPVMFFISIFISGWNEIKSVFLEEKLSINRKLSL